MLPVGGGCARPPDMTWAGAEYSTVVVQLAYYKRTTALLRILRIRMVDLVNCSMKLRRR